MSEQKKVVISQAQSKDLPQYLLGDFTPTIQLQSNKTDRGKKCMPEMKYGVSYESPSYFRSSHTLICKDSYKNPFIEQQQQQTGSSGAQQEMSFKKWGDFKYSSNQQTFSIKDNANNIDRKQIFDLKKIGTKTQYNVITNQTSVNDIPDLAIIERPKASESYQQQMKSKGNFKRTKEYFGDFVERNDVMAVFSIQERERPKNFKVVKNYAYSQDERKRIHEIRRQASLAHQNHSKTSSLLGSSQTLQADTLKYYNLTDKDELLKNEQFSLIDDSGSPSHKMFPKIADNHHLKSSKSSTVIKFQDEALQSSSKYNEGRHLRSSKLFNPLLNNSSQNLLQQYQLAKTNSINNIFLRSPIAKSFHDPNLFIDRDQSHINSMQNKIILDKMKMDLENKITKKKFEYFNKKPSHDYQENKDYISEFEKLQQNLIRQKKAQKNAVFNKEQLVYVQPEYNQGKIWFSDTTPLQNNK